jgi:hypothetical protein
MENSFVGWLLMEVLANEGKFLKFTSLMTISISLYKEKIATLLLKL